MSRAFLLRTAIALSAVAAACCRADLSIVASHRIDPGGGRYTAFPAIYWLDDGKTVAFDVTARYRRSHHDANGEPISLLSSDCGTSWRAGAVHLPPRLFADTEGADYRLVTAKAWKPLKEGEAASEGTYVWRENGKAYVAIGVVEKTTHDSGRTWQLKDLPVPRHAMLMNYNIASNVQTSRGTRMTALYFKEGPQSPTRVLVAIRKRAESNWRFVQVPEADDGSTGFNETALVELPDGRVAALMRPDPDTIGDLFLSVSDDEGATWSTPRKTAIHGYPASAVMDGRHLVVTVGNRRANPMSIDAYLLDPKTLSVEKRLSLDSAQGNAADFGYPVSIACKDRLLTTYYLPGPNGSAFAKILTWKY